jgi:hypothetical protein
MASKRVCFTEFQKSLLKELVNKNLKIIENKNTDFKSTSDKIKAWGEIEKE